MVHAGSAPRAAGGEPRRGVFGIDYFAGVGSASVATP
jgi:hypothetical protein